MRFALLIAAALACGVAQADVTVITRRAIVSTAADDAVVIARTGVLRHLGRAGGRLEGIGFSTASPEAALRACCFYGRYRIVDSSVVWSPVRRGWFAVIRFQ